MQHYILAFPTAAHLRGDVTAITEPVQSFQHAHPLQHLATLPFTVCMLVLCAAKPTGMSPLPCLGEMS